MVAPLVLAADVPAMAPYYLLVAPGLVIGLLALNLPLAATVFRRARMDDDTRRNHALEHATVDGTRSHCPRGFAGRLAPRLAHPADQCSGGGGGYGGPGPHSVSRTAVAQPPLRRLCVGLRPFGMTFLLPAWS
jgi:hypothetical protein